MDICDIVPRGLGGNLISDYYHIWTYVTSFLEDWEAGLREGGHKGVRREGSVIQGLAGGEDSTRLQSLPPSLTPSRTPSHSHTYQVYDRGG